MPWFLTSLISNETLHRRAEKHGIRNEPRSRTFGFYDHYTEACKAIQENRGNMVECLYDYLVLEYIEQGIHPMVLKEEWWLWSEGCGRWLAMEQRPAEYAGTVNFALG